MTLRFQQSPPPPCFKKMLPLIELISGGTPNGKRSWRELEELYLGRPADRSLFRSLDVELPTDQTSDLFFHCQAPVNEVGEEKYRSFAPPKEGQEWAV